MTEVATTSPAAAIEEMTRSRRSVADLEVAGRRVLVRVDFNVPLEDGRVVDDLRIRAAIPTIESVRSRGGRVVLVTHLGRPGGRVVDDLRVAPLAARLGELLGTSVRVAPDVAGEGARRVVAGLADGDVAMLENVRFEPGEERDDPELAGRLAGLADLYVDDAFGASHRAHASTHGVAARLPNGAGLLMLRELEMLGRVLREPRRPLVAIVGGSKISSKIGVLQTLLSRVDTLWLGGAMACTFYRALGEETGRSLVEADQVATAAALLEAAREPGAADLRLPVDVVVAAAPRAGEPTRVVSWKEVAADATVVDVGPDTVAAIAADCAAAATVVWNGPLGIYEIEAFARGTRGVAHAIASGSAVSIVGGGDAAAAVEAAGVADRITHMSTGGGATLELLEGRVLPGVAVLDLADG